MAKCIYICGLEPGGGKSLVTLGLMELLSRRVERLGFFRPIVRSTRGADNDIQLMRFQYDLWQSYEESFAATHQQAQKLIADGRENELQKKILAQFKRLERQCDFVVCEGTDDTGLSSAFEFDFNAEVASNLGSAVVVVLNGKKSSEERLAAGIASAREQLAELNTNVAATIVNRVPPEKLALIDSALRKHALLDDSTFMIPETAVLSFPTVGEISDALSAEVIKLCSAPPAVSLSDPFCRG